MMVGTGGAQEAKNSQRLIFTLRLPGYQGLRWPSIRLAPSLPDDR